MALNELVRYVSRTSASRLVDLYELAAKHDWDENDVYAFLRCRQAPPPKMLRTMAKELGLDVKYMQQVLNR